MGHSGQCDRRVCRRRSPGRTLKKLSKTPSSRSLPRADGIFSKMRRLRSHTLPSRLTQASKRVALVRRRTPRLRPAPCRYLLATRARFAPSHKNSLLGAKLATDYLGLISTLNDFLFSAARVCVPADVSCRWQFADEIRAPRMRE